MNFKRITACSAAIACGATLGMSSAAGADAAHATFANMYPVANSLCTHVRAGTEANRLKPFATQVQTACTTAETEFTAARTAALTGQAAVRNAMALNHATYKAACPKFAKSHPACVTAGRNAQATYKKLAAQRRVVDSTFGKAVEAIRKKFWASIHSIPGAKHLRTDKPIKS
jgi:hypothetical protein